MHTLRWACILLLTDGIMRTHCACGMSYCAYTGVCDITFEKALSLSLSLLRRLDVCSLLGDKVCGCRTEVCLMVVVPGSLQFGKVVWWPLPVVTRHTKPWGR